MSCPLCGGAPAEPFVNRTGVPILQNAPAVSRAAAIARARGELAITACTACGFVFNRAFDPALVEYAESYDNTQAHSPHFDRYLRELALDLIDRHHLRGKRVVEIGCGKGQFLRLLCELGDNHGVGYDPTYEGPSSDGRVTFVRELYTDSEMRADLVCCRHVLEHVPDPLALLAAAHRAAGPGIPVCFEVPTVDWILATTSFWDFFYEHCSYFTATTLAFAFRTAGFAVTTARTAFGDQYLWLEARTATRDATRPDPAAARAAIAAYRTRASDRLDALAAQLRAAAGELAIWGAGAKGVTLANLLDPAAELVRCVVDINPAKQGRFIPGTGHPIVAPAELAQVRHLLVMNPNYAAEIAATVAPLGDFTITTP